MKLSVFISSPDQENVESPISDPDQEDIEWTIPDPDQEVSMVSIDNHILFLFIIAIVFIVYFIKTRKS